MFNTKRKKVDMGEDSSHLLLQGPLIRTLTISPAVLVIPPYSSITRIFTKLTQYLNTFSDIFLGLKMTQKR